MNVVGKDLLVALENEKTDLNLVVNNNFYVISEVYFSDLRVVKKVEIKEKMKT